MRKMIFAAATAIAATVAFAAPAQANEGRVGVHGGVLWSDGDSEGVLGAMAGYDFDLGQQGFVGVEGSVDKILEDGVDLIGSLTARGGLKVGAKGKAYALAGYTFTEGDDLPHAGLGYQHKLGERFFVNAEYRHYFADGPDANAATVGLGLTF